MRIRNGIEVVPMLLRRRFVVIGLGTAVLALSAGLTYGIALGQGPDEGYAIRTNEVAAARVLGQDLPKPASIVPGWTRVDLEVTPADPALPLLPAMVHQAFAISGENVAVMTVFRGKLKLDIPSAFDELVEINGVSVAVKKHQLPNGAASVNYKWARHDLVYNVEVMLIRGIDRSTADRIVNSIP